MFRVEMILNDYLYQLDDNSWLGLDDVNFRWERDNKYFGVFPEIFGSLTFINPIKSIIEKEILYNPLKVTIRLKLYDLSNDELFGEYDFDILTFDSDILTLKIQVELNSLYKKLRKNTGKKVDIFYDQTLQIDETTSDNITSRFDYEFGPSKYRFDIGKLGIVRSSRQILNGKYFNWFFAFFNVIVSGNVTSYINILLPENSDDEIGIYNQSVFYSPYSYPTSGTSSILPIISPQFRFYIIKCPGKYKINLKYSITEILTLLFDPFLPNTTILDVGESLNIVLNVTLSLYINYVETILDVAGPFVFNINGPIFLNVNDYKIPQEYTYIFNYTNTFTLNIDDVIFYNIRKTTTFTYVVVPPTPLTANVSIDSFYTYGEFSINSLDCKSSLNTNHYGALVHEVLSSIVEYWTDNKLRVKSPNTFSRPNSLSPYSDVDLISTNNNFGSLYAMTLGKFISGTLETIMSMSFDEVYEGLDRIFNLSIVYDIREPNRLTIDRFEDAFKDEFIMDIISNDKKEDINFNIFDDFFYSSIKGGYDKYEKDVFILDQEFNTERTWDISGINVDIEKVYDIRCGFVVGSYTIEKIRNVESNTKTYDENIILISLTDYFTSEVGIQEQVGFDNSDLLNFRIRPLYNMIQHSNRWGITTQYLTPNIDKIRITEAPKNYNAGGFTLTSADFTKDIEDVNSPFTRLEKTPVEVNVWDDPFILKNRKRKPFIEPFIYTVNTILTLNEIKKIRDGLLGIYSINGTDDRYYFWSLSWDISGKSVIKLIKKVKE